MTTHPQNMQKVVHLLEQETCQRVRTKTLKRLRKKNRQIWQRMQHTPEKKPAPAKYERSKAFINRPHTRAKQGEGDVWYFDASGFCFCS